MVTPQIAAVRPRAHAPSSGEILPLEDLVAEELSRGSRIIQIHGGPGSGKTTALAHLAATLPPARDVVLLDDASVTDVATQASRLRVICTNRLRYPAMAPVIVPLPLAAWTDDEVLEYLRAVAPDRCGSVMSRWSALPGASDLGGNPDLVRAVIDLFVADLALASIRVAIQRIVLACIRTPAERRVAADFCLAILAHNTAEAARQLELLADDAEDFERLRALRHPLVQRILGGERIAKLILSDGECPHLARRLPSVLVQELAWLAARDSVLAERLHAIYASDRRSYHPQVATILFAMDRTWRPYANRKASLSGASFVQAKWPGLKLLATAEGASDFSGTNLACADLCAAQLDGISAIGVQLAGARLDKASLVRVVADQANLAGARLVAVNAERIVLHGASLKDAVLDDASLVHAELDDADLTGARFCKADLSGSFLLRCKIEGTDFTGANLCGATLRELDFREALLDGASFHLADMARCDLEGVSLVAPDFVRARLKGALLTGSVLPQADLRGADLRDAGLADIHWERANLRDADLRGCTFHMGSTRSGLVGSPYPGHGSKTGFYTDDYHDQDFKLPEEIRKANLCGADVRGARLDDVDFYLVDLRGALLDDDALEQVQRSGAILFDRCA